MCSNDKNFKNIIPKILDGDTDLYREIVTEYKNYIFTVVSSMIKNYHTAEDITQEVFINGYIKLNSLSDYNKIGAWLVKIAKNKCLRFLERETLNHNQECELNDFIPDMQNQTENYVVEKLENENIKKVVENLTDVQKTVTILFYFEKHSQKEIAEILNIPEGTVKRRLHDARLNLKKELENMNTEIKTKLSNDDEFEEKVMAVINNILPKMQEEDFLKLVDEEIKKFGNNKNALGMLYYWRGASQTGGKRQNLNGAKNDYEKAAEYINSDSKYKGAAFAGVKIIDILNKDNDIYMPEIKMSVAGEVLKEYGNKIDWLCNPGFNHGGFECPQAAYNQIYLWAARANKHLIDLDIKVGELRTDESNGAVMTVVSKDETITVLAGTFENCLHIKVKFENAMTNRYLNGDIWYANDIGLIKFQNDGGIDANYELSHYKIKGGSGYIPVAVGNLWNYKSTTISEKEYYQFNEYEIVSVAEKDDGKYINLSAVNCFKQKKI